MFIEDDRRSRCWSRDRSSCCYCGTLVPAIGLLQAGDQAMADRVTYVPSLGVLILAIWGAYELTKR
jgi:hypothetical protein